MTSVVRVCTLYVLSLLVPVISFNHTEVKRQIVDYYNMLRSVHDAPPLVVDASLDESALQWATHLSITPNSSSCLHHSRAGGENIYFEWSSRGLSEAQFARATVKAFYEEIRLYDYTRPGLLLEAAHFTNMIWRNCERMGIGIAYQEYTDSHGACGVRGSVSRPMKGYLVVVHQWPPSNVMTTLDFQQNVLPPRQPFTFA